MDEPSSALLPIVRAVEHLPGFALAPNRLERTRQGSSTRVVDAMFTDRQILRMTSAEGELVAIGMYSAEEGAVKPKVVLV
jgi:tRNA U55 pseudouridine synthase TruB